MGSIRCASWNVNSLNVRLPQVLQWLAQANVDALVLQETKMTDDAFPKEAIEQAGYEVHFCGQKTYNGVAILTNKATIKPMTLLTKNIPGYPDDQKRLIAAQLCPVGGKVKDSFVFVGGYFPNGGEVGSQKYLYKLDWITALTHYLKDVLKDNPRVLLGGDFNIAPTWADVYNGEMWGENVLCTTQERAAYTQILNLGFTDTFRAHHPNEKNRFSWWDYRSRAFDKNMGVRIDLLLASDELMKKVQYSDIDENPRHNQQPSDHAPVVVTLTF